MGVQLYRFVKPFQNYISGYQHTSAKVLSMIRTSQRSHPRPRALVCLDPIDNLCFGQSFAEICRLEFIDIKIQVKYSVSMKLVGGKVKLWPTNH